MRRLFLFALLPLILVAAGCGEPEPEPEPEPVAPPPPTAQELYQRLYQPLQPLWAAVQNDQGMSRMQMDQALEAFRQARQQVAAEINAKEALDKIKTDLSGAITKGKREDRGKAVWLGCMAWEVVEPGSTRYQSQLEWAKLVLARPEVQVKGFMGDGDNTYAFLEVTDPETRAVTNYQVREGEEFHAPNGTILLKLGEIVGDQSSVMLEYIPLENQEFEVRSPSEKRRNPLNQ